LAHGLDSVGALALQDLRVALAGGWIIDSENPAIGEIDGVIGGTMERRIAVAAR
jgi:hypothetical protein